MVTYWFTECYHEAATPSRWRQHLAWTRKLIAGEYSNWFALWDQSEMNMVLMSAQWVYNKSKLQENSVAACPPRWLVRRMRIGRQSLRQAVCQRARPSGSDARTIAPGVVVGKERLGQLPSAVRDVEVLEQLAGNVARDNKKTRTIPVTSSSPSTMTRNCPNSSLVLPLPKVVSSPTSWWCSPHRPWRQASHEICCNLDQISLYERHRIVLKRKLRHIAIKLA